MGYRERLGRIDKNEIAKYLGKTKKQIEEEFGELVPGEGYDFPFAYPKEHEELYELGKYCDFKLPGKKPFYGFELDDYEFSIITKEDFQLIIADYHKAIVEYYKKILAEKERHEAFFIRQISEWENPFNCKPYSTNDSSDTVVTSWLYEYAIFELVRIYKTFNWKDDFLIFSGW